MGSVLLKAFSFTFIIVIGIVMRSTGMVTEHAGEAMKKILISVTLPAAVITNFSAIEKMGPEMLVIAVMGIAANVSMLAVGAWISKKKSRGEQALYMLCLPAFNIGAFGLPFVQSFLPAIGSVTACMFDVGNSIMCTGVNYAFVAEYTSEKAEHSDAKVNDVKLTGRVSAQQAVSAKTKKNRRLHQGLDVKAFVKRLITSPPLVTYVVMFLLATCGIKVPQVVVSFVEPISRANTFVAMLMLGLLFRLELKRDYLKDILQVVLWRHGFALLAALLIYFVAPWELLIRQTLVLIMFAPMSAVAPAYTGMCGGDEGKASAANSVTILCSLVIITVLIAAMGLNN